MAVIPCTLLVDDDAATNYLNHRLLTRLAVSDTVLVAVNGEEALALLHHHCQEAPAPTCPALILLDMKMPRMNGFEFLQAYAQRPPTQNPAVVIIMLTTSLNLEDVAKMQHLPIAGYLTKPLTTEKITQIMAEHFGHTSPGS